jgi:SulP family sulfate permease
LLPRSTPKSTSLTRRAVSSVGLGLFIAVGQVPELVGIEKPEGNTVHIFVTTLRDIGTWEWTTVAVGIASLAAWA